jgi:hypothetical protein
MRRIFGLSRYLVYIAVIGLLLAGLAVFVFGGITTVTTTIGIFQHGEFNAEGARIVSVEFIELIDLFLLGTVLLITAIGLYQLFIDPGVGAVIPAWLSVSNIAVMLGILFLGAVAGEQPAGTGILEYGLAIAAVLAGLALVVYVFSRTVHQMEAAKHEAEHVSSAEHAPEHH